MKNPYDTPVLRPATPKPTPAPWEVNQWASGIEISAPDQHCTVALLRDCNNAEANAAFIVTACNSHAALAEALEKILMAPDYQIYDIASEAIRKAQGARINP